MVKLKDIEELTATRHRVRDTTTTQTLDTNMNYLLPLVRVSKISPKSSSIPKITTKSV